MPSWTCDIVGARPDGDLTWRRTDASEPRGTIPLELLPTGATIGSRVVVHVERDPSGQWTVLRCELPPVEHPNRDLIIPSPTAESPSNIHYLQFGQIRWCNVRNPREDREAVGKWRPSLLISEELTKWRIMGFTTKSVYESGHARVEIPNYRSIGLDKTGYLWGHKLTRIDTTDIGDLIGEADVDLLKDVLSLARADLRMSELATLRCAISIKTN